MTLASALNRTFLLMGELQRANVNDSTLLRALTSTEIVLFADADNIQSHSAQSAFVTAALLMARSGHRVHLSAPNVDLIGRQSPLRRGGLIEQLVQVGGDLLPGIDFKIGAPDCEVDLIVSFGSSKAPATARHRFSLNADDWTGLIRRGRFGSRWHGADWPIGGLAAAGLAAGEAFKVALRKLRSRASKHRLFDELAVPIGYAAITLGRPGIAKRASLGSFDVVSAGAISNSLLYVLSRLPGVNGEAQIFDDDFAEISNLNRYALLLFSHLSSRKVDHLAGLDLGQLWVRPIPQRFEAGISVGANRSILVGADDIPTRWVAQRSWPEWLGVGATTHWSAMASFHQRGIGCAECLHPTDDLTSAPIPTVAFVSFWAGLILATQFVRHAAGEIIPLNEQQIFLTPLRPEGIWRSPVAVRPACPSCGRNSSRAA
jgi:hypothetical protein